MYGLFEKNDIDRTKEMLVAARYTVISENQKPSVYNIKNTVITQEYGKDNRVVRILYSTFGDDESNQNITIYLEVVINGKREIVNMAENYSEIESFVNADENQLQDMISVARARRAESMNQFIKSLK